MKKNIKIKRLNNLYKIKYILKMKCLKNKQKMKIYNFKIN